MGNLCKPFKWVKDELVDPFLPLLDVVTDIYTVFNWGWMMMINQRGEVFFFFVLGVLSLITPSMVYFTLGICGCFGKKNGRCGPKTFWPLCGPFLYIKLAREKDEEKLRKWHRTNVYEVIFESLPQMILQWIGLLFLFLCLIFDEIFKQHLDDHEDDAKILFDFDIEEEGMIPWGMKLALLVTSACLSTISVHKGFWNSCKACCCKRREPSQVPTNDIEITTRN